MFVFKDGQPTIEPKMLFVPEFRRIWDRDKSAGKKTALKELAFVYFTADYKSEYNAYGLEKEELVAQDIMGDPKYQASPDILNAIEKYEMMQETYSMRYLAGVRKTVDSLIKYYEDLLYDPKKVSNKEFKPEQITKALKDLESVMEKIEKWERKVAAEEDGMQIRGGGKVGIFEDADKATWLKKYDK